MNKNDIKLGVSLLSGLGAVSVIKRTNKMVGKGEGLSVSGLGVMIFETMAFFYAAGRTAGIINAVEESYESIKKKMTGEGSEEDENEEETDGEE